MIKFKKLLSKFNKNPRSSTEFSRFFIESSKKEKMEVFLSAAKKANKEQRELFYSSKKHCKAN